jgi:peroxiredoxin family protein
MTDGDRPVAVVLSSPRPEAARIALDLLAAAVAMETETHLYLTGDAVLWVGRPAGDTAVSEASESVRAAVTSRLREIKQDGVLHVYACTGAMKAHGITKDALAPEVDMPAGFAYLLTVASDAMTFSF